MNEAEAEAKAKIALTFLSQILHFDPLFLQTTKFWSILTGLQTFRLKTGFNKGTLSANTPRMTSYAFGRRLLLLCLHTE